MTSEREDKPTVAMRREELLGLVAQSIAPEAEEGISPILVLVVIALFVGLFVAIVRVS